MFDFYQDWSDAINLDLQQLTSAVDQVLGNSTQNSEHENPPINTNTAENTPGHNLNENATITEEANTNMEAEPIVKAEVQEEEKEVKAKVETKADVKAEPVESQPPNKVKDDREKELDDLLEDQRKNEFNPADIFTTGDSGDEEKRKERKPGKKDKTRRDSLVEKKGKKEKEKKEKKKNKMRKPSSEHEGESEKKKRKKKFSDCDSNVSTAPDVSPHDVPSTSAITMAGRKISEISGSSGSPVRPALSVSPESDLLSPEHSSAASDRPDGTELDIRELDKSNQAVRERMDQMVKEKIKAHDRHKMSQKDKKHKKRDSLKGREKTLASSDLTQEAVRSLSFEVGSERSDASQEQVGNAEDEENSDEKEPPNEELAAALAGLDSDFDFATKKEPESGEEKSPTKTPAASIVVPNGAVEQEVKIKVADTKASLLDKKFKRKLSAPKMQNKEPPPTKLVMPTVKAEVKQEPVSASVAEGKTELEMQIAETMARQSSVVKVSPIAQRRNSQPEAANVHPVQGERRLSTISCDGGTTGIGSGMKTDPSVLSVALPFEQQPKRVDQSPTIKLPGVKPLECLPTIVKQQTIPKQQQQQQHLQQHQPAQPALQQASTRQPSSQQPSTQMTVLQLAPGQNVASQNISSRLVANSAPMQILKSPGVVISSTARLGPVATQVAKPVQQTVITPTRAPPQPSKTLIIRSNPSPQQVQLQQPTAQLRTVTPQQVLVQQAAQNNQGSKIIQGVPLTQQSNAVYRRVITSQGSQIQTPGQGTGYITHLARVLYHTFGGICQ